MESSMTERILLILLGLVFVSSIAALLYQLLKISPRDDTSRYSLGGNQTVAAQDDSKLAAFAPVSANLHNLSALNL